MMMLYMLLLTCWRPVQCLGNINHVDNDRLDSIPFAFDLDETNRSVNSGAQATLKTRPDRRVTLAIRRGIL